jgi:hypothetical protein
MEKFDYRSHKKIMRGGALSVLFSEVYNNSIDLIFVAPALQYKQKSEQNENEVENNRNFKTL